MNNKQTDGSRAGATGKLGKRQAIYEDSPFPH